MEVTLDPPPSRPLARSRTSESATHHLRAWLLSCCGKYDFGIEQCGKAQLPSDERLELHLNAKNNPSMLPELRLQDVAQHRAGELTLHVTPKRDGARRKSAMAVCYEFHHDSNPAEARRALDLINYGLHAGWFYIERVPGVTYAWALYTLPKYHHKVDGQNLRLGKREANVFKKKMHASIQRLLRIHGCAARVELRGGFTELEECNGIKRVVQRGEAFRAPRCPEEGDGVRLNLARFGSRIIHRILALGEFLIPLYVEPLLDGSPVEPDLAYDQLVGCVIDSVREVFGSCLSSHHLEGPQVDQIVEVATSNWRLEHGDASMERMRRALRPLIHAVVGGSILARDYQGLWFTPEDLARAEEIIRARISAAQLRALNLDPKLHGCKITYFALAVALCTIGKNSHLKMGYVPSSSIKGMQQHFRIRSHGSHVRILNEVLIDSGLLRCISRSYRPEGWCRRYALTAVCYTIPFLAHEQPAEETQLIGISGSGEGSHERKRNKCDVETISYSIKFSFTFEDEMRALHPDVYGTAHYQDEGDPAEFLRN